MPISEFTIEQLQAEILRKQGGKQQFDKIKFEYGPFGEGEAIRHLVGGTEHGFYSLDGKKLDFKNKPYGYRVTEDDIKVAWKAEGYE